MTLTISFCRGEAGGGNENSVDHMFSVHEQCFAESSIQKSHHLTKKQPCVEF